MRLFEGTEWDRPPRCDRCGELEQACTCPPPKFRIPPEQQTARVTVEKRKRGKRVTVVRGLSPEATDLAWLVSELKSACGAGGTAKADTIEVQGDQLVAVRDRLGALGFRVQG